MKPAPFEYVRAETAEHAVELLKQYGDEAKLLAGGQSLIPMMNLRLARPSILIGIGKLPLSFIHADKHSILVGALTTHRTLLASEVASLCPIIPQAARHIAHPVIRNAGTAGGSVAHADPAAELSALLVLLDGIIQVRSSAGERKIGTEAFFKSAFTTALTPEEMIAAIEFRPPSGSYEASFLEVSERHGDFAIAAVGCVIAVENGAVSAARIVLSGAEAIPVRAAKAETLLLGRAPGTELASEAAAEAIRDFRPYSDIRASSDYRKALLEELTRRALARAFQQQREGHA
jgi:aerobic carbon-monoxide dehydrogenase medium subunit